MAIGVLLSGTFLFVSGAALAFFVVVPLALPWLFGFASPSMVPLITAEDYFSFLFAMVLTFGVSFELPIVVLALATLGIVTPQFLSKYRRHAIVVIVIIGAFLTPGDLVWTTIWLSVPLYGLYELQRRRRIHSSTNAKSAGARQLEGPEGRRESGGALAAALTVVPRRCCRAQIGRLPPVRPTVQQPARRDTTKDSTRFKFPEADSIARSLLSRPGYSLTHYAGDTAFFDADNHILDLLAAGKRRVGRAARFADGRQRQRHLLQSGEPATHHRRLTTCLPPAADRPTFPATASSRTAWPSGRFASRTRDCR